MKTRLLPIALTMLLPVVSGFAAWSSSKVQTDSQGRLTYPSDAAGNRIPDFSNAGYKGGGVPLPTVPVRLTISAVDGDDTASIQAALDAVGALPVQPDGYRGTVLLTAGVYDVAGTIRIRHSGVVLSGLGDGDDPATNTILRRTGTSQANVIQAGGGSDDSFRSEIPGSRVAITTPRVSVGSRTFTVDNPSGFAVGDNVIVFHPSTAAWIAAMNNGGVTDANVWRPGDIDIRYHRYITAISGNTIEIDAPVFNHLERSLSQSYLYKYDRTGMLSNLGIEDLQIDIVTAGPTSETHCEDAVEFSEAEDSWIRDCTMKHFWHAGVQFAGSTRCTAERVKAIDPHSVVTGGRRYNFSTYHAQLILFRDCLASYSRHGFVCNGTSADSGIVVLDSRIDHPLTFAEPHRRWSTGVLFDGIVTTNRGSVNDVLGLYNRGNYGTGHGWAAGHSVMWRCDAAGGKILVQQPPTAQNYAIGCFGNVTGSGPFAGPVGYREGSNTAGLEPASLYLRQLADRLAGAPPPDFTAPGAAVLTATVTTSSSVALAWTAASDNVGVIGYDVFANGAFAGFSNGTAFTVIDLTGGTAYSFTVRARDAAGNSTPSNAVTATTAAGPVVPQPIVYEAENLEHTRANGSYSISFEDTPSGGAFASPNISDPAHPLYPVRRRYVTFGGDGVPPPPNGEWIEFKLPAVPAGTYNLVLRYKSHPTNRAIMSLSVDGAPLGGTLDQRTTATFPSRDFGVVRFPVAGDHYVRLNITGKSNTTGPWNIAPDAITLVPDTVAPVIAPLANLTAEATGPDGAVFTYAGTATDDKDGPVPVLFDPPSGSVFPLGSTIVVALAQDLTGNLAGSTFTATVTDTTPPVLELPDNFTVEATSPAGAVVQYAALATDVVSGEVGVTFAPDSGSTFPIGSTVVTATAVDDSENATSGTFNVIVQDTTGPSFQSLVPSQVELWPANHQMVPISLAVVVRDTADAAPVTRIISVSSNEPANGQGDGNTEPDWAITGPLTLQLRAERSGGGHGRIYTIAVESRDSAGNTSTATTSVMVPKSKGK